MPKTLLPPKYRFHKARKCAVVRIAGKDHYLGEYGSQESKERYSRILAELWGKSPLTTEPTARGNNTGFTITELCAVYMQWAQGYYRKNGKPTAQVSVIRGALRPLRKAYGSLTVSAFGKQELKAVRAMMLDSGICRKEINRRVCVIRGALRWAEGEALAPEGIAYRLTLEPLKEGRTTAVDHPPVTPVSNADLQATLPYMPPVLRDVATIQRFTGARPGEILTMRPMDVDHSGEVWRYTPATHKTQHKGKSRVIVIGPRAQAVLAKYLLRPAEAYCFSPRESERNRLTAMRANRKTKVQPSQRDRSKSRPKRKPRERYGKDSYNNAVRRACVKAGVPLWHPNQLRHAAATEIRSVAGLDVAAAVLGHARPDTTLIYAANELAKAESVVQMIG